MHYIEDAEEMADRIGVIHKGELVLVEDKATLMRKLGKRQLALSLQEPLPAIPAALADLPLELSADGATLTYTFDVQQEERTGIASLLRRLADEGRSEEHTSELQSLMRISYAVFCLKKKKNTNITILC